MVSKGDSLNITVLNNNVKKKCLTGRNVAEVYAVEGRHRDPRAASAADLSSPQPFQQFSVNPAKTAVAEHANNVAALRIPSDV